MFGSLALQGVLIINSFQINPRCIIPFSLAITESMLVENKPVKTFASLVSLAFASSACVVRKAIANKPAAALGAAAWTFCGSPLVAIFVINAPVCKLAGV